MAQCVKCEQKVGFFSSKQVGLVGPLCKACQQPLLQSVTDLVLKYAENGQAMEDDPKRGAWVALANLLCAEKVNVLVETWVGVSQIPLKDETWQASRDKAIEYASAALNRTTGNATWERFLNDIIDRARRIEGGHGPQHKKIVRLTSVGILPGGGTTHPPEQWALMSGLVTLEDFTRFAEEFPEGRGLLA